MLPEFLEDLEGISGIVFIRARAHARFGDARIALQVLQPRGSTRSECWGPAPSSTLPERDTESSRKSSRMKPCARRSRRPFVDEPPPDARMLQHGTDAARWNRHVSAVVELDAHQAVVTDREDAPFGVVVEVVPVEMHCNAITHSSLRHVSAPLHRAAALPRRMT